MSILRQETSGDIQGGWTSRDTKRMGIKEVDLKGKLAGLRRWLEVFPLVKIPYPCEGKPHNSPLYQLTQEIRPKR